MTAKKTAKTKVRKTGKKTPSAKTLRARQERRALAKARHDLLSMHAIGAEIGEFIFVEAVTGSILNEGVVPDGLAEKAYAAGMQYVQTLARAERAILDWKPAPPQKRGELH